MTGLRSWGIRDLDNYRFDTLPEDSICIQGKRFIVFGSKGPKETRPRNVLSRANCFPTTFAAPPSSSSSSSCAARAALAPCAARIPSFGRQKTERKAKTKRERERRIIYDRNLFRNIREKMQRVKFSSVGSCSWKDGKAKGGKEVSAALASRVPPLITCFYAALP